MKRLLFAFCVVSIFVLPSVAFAEEMGIVREALNTVGKPVVTILVVGVFTWITAYVLGSLGMGNLGNMVKIAGVFGCLGLVVKVVIDGLTAVTAAFGLKLW